jgi:hypothetical protein
MASSSLVADMELDRVALETAGLLRKSFFAERKCQMFVAICPLSTALPLTLVGKPLSVLLHMPPYER